MLILRTFEHYKSLIETIFIAAQNFEDTDWKSSFSYELLECWADKMASTRDGAENYRDLILEMYILLRDGAKKEWSDDSFDMILWTRFHDLEASHTSARAGRERPGGGTSASNPRCGHCKHRWDHTAPECPLKEYKATHAQALIKGVPKAKCGAVADTFMDSVLPSKPDADIVAAITAARAQHGF